MNSVQVKIRQAKACDECQTGTCQNHLWRVCRISEDVSQQADKVTYALQNLKKTMCLWHRELLIALGQLPPTEAWPAWNVCCSTRIRTGVTRFRVWSDNQLHYTAINFATAATWDMAQILLTASWASVA